MRSPKKTLTRAARAIAMATGILTVTPIFAAQQATEGDAEAGKKIANERKLGNCVACHSMPDAESPGAIGPVLIQMQSRYPDKEKLRAQIWDATVANPDSSMPPFGKHGILDEQQLNDVVEYIWSI